VVLWAIPEPGVVGVPDQVVLQKSLGEERASRLRSLWEVGSYRA
jgi:hypothetical protein